MNYLILIILIESFFILMLLFIIFRINSKLVFLKNHFSNDLYTIKGSDLFNNITKSKNLYRDLLIELHPDKFHNDPTKLEKSENLALMLGKNKNSFRELISLAKIAKIDFDFSSKFKNQYPEIFE
jgi:hypothetical protein